jgi:polyribonucleotide 5'-hydroxyl-kinase
MALPGLALPGLGSFPDTFVGSSENSSAITGGLSKSIKHLVAEQEYRFESSFTRPVTIKLVSGTAEIFGTDLAPSLEYTFHGTKAAIFTWTGCEVEVTGGRDEDYVAGDTPMYQYANIHNALEDMRADSEASRQIGPRVLLIGPDNVGKTALGKILISYAVKQEREPVFINLDPQEGALSVPGALSATAIGSVLDVEQGWGTSPISGPSAFPVKTPLCFPFVAGEPLEYVKLFKNYISRLSSAVSTRYEDEPEVKFSGCIIDTPGVLGTGKPEASELIHHTIAEFSVNIILILAAADKVFHEIKNRFGSTISVLRIDKSGGCVDRDENYMRELRQSQVRQYFYGHGSMSLTPFSQFLDFNQVAIYRIATVSTGNKYFDPGADDDDDEEYDPASVSSFTGLHERITPSQDLRNAVLAVTHADASATLEQIKDSSIMCYVYINDVDETKRRLKILSPINGRIPSNALIWGNWPESISDLQS